MRVVWRLCVIAFAIVLLGRSNAAALQFLHFSEMDRITRVEREILIYAAVNCSFPDSTMFLELSGVDPNSPWLIYEYPAQYGTLPFDLYSTGINRIDEQGAGDDISNWSGIPDIPVYDISNYISYPPEPLLMTLFYGLFPGSFIVHDILTLSGIVAFVMLAVRGVRAVRVRRGIW